MGSRLGAEMTSREPEVRKKPRDTVMDTQHFNGFLHV